MGRNPKIKLKIFTEKELNKIIACSCGNKQTYRTMQFYVDESNISITNNSTPKCYKCARKSNST